MNNLVITIGREFGSGGKYIGEKLAEELGFKFYDKSLLERVSKESQIDLSLLEASDEKEKNRFWYSLAVSSLSSSDSVNSLMDLPNTERYFIEETKVIEEIAENENCVIIGRCSNRILKNHANAIHIFVYATDLEFKVNRKMKYGNLTEKEAMKLIHKMDKQRATYYEYYTDGKWGNKEDFDLCIDTSIIGVDATVELIKKYIELKTKK